MQVCYVIRGACVSRVLSEEWLMGSALQISRNNSRTLDHLSLQLLRSASLRRADTEGM